MVFPKLQFHPFGEEQLYLLSLLCPNLEEVPGAGEEVVPVLVEGDRHNPETKEMVIDHMASSLQFFGSVR